jgi:hypothetical protein
LLRHIARLVVDYFASRKLSVDYFAYTTRPGASHVARLVTWLVVDYSVRHDIVLRPHWLYLSHTVRHDYLSRDNSGSISTTPHATVTSSFGCITSTIHLDWFSKLVENGSHAPNN